MINPDDSLIHEALMSNSPYLAYNSTDLLISNQKLYSTLNKLADYQRLLGNNSWLPSELPAVNTVAKEDLVQRLSLL